MSVLFYFEEGNQRQISYAGSKKPACSSKPISFPLVLKLTLLSSNVVVVDSCTSQVFIIGADSNSAPLFLSKQIVSDIVSSDFVIIAAPSYWADVPGQLKTFFDRNTPYGDTNPNRILKAEKPIKGIAIAVRAGVRQQENELILNSIQHYYGHLGIETVKRISLCETDTPEDLKTKHQKEIEEIYQLDKNITTL